MNLSSITAALLATASLATAKIYLSETFDNEDWKSTWSVPSLNTNDLGNWEISSGKFFADENVNRGLRTTDNMHFYALTAPLQEPFSNQDRDLIIQFSAKNEQGLDCGGAYLKMLSGDVNIDEFSGQTPYKIMFGPDVCGTTRRVHLILERGGQGRMIKKQIDFTNDEFTHMYTLIISQPDKTYRILIDGKEVATGNLVNDIEDMTAEPEMIPDSNAVKPENWVEESQIADAEDKKPEDWDENETWTPRMIDNPDYKGPWTAPLIPNPAFKLDKDLAVYNLAFVGFDLWQVKAGTIFDNILVTDDLAEAQKALETLFIPFKELEIAAESVFVNGSTSTESLNNEVSGEQEQQEDEDQLESGSEHTDL